MNHSVLNAPALDSGATHKSHARRAERIGALAFPAAVLLLLVLNMWLSQSLGQARTMYDNPIYRWRESIAIALSRMHDVPAQGYLAHRSVQKHLAGHGLGLLENEAIPLPSPQERKALIYDSERLETLFREASKVTVDPSLPPVTMEGNELGLADYYHWAFTLFGINLLGLWLLYFVILSISVLLFYSTFRRCQFCLLLLLFYLIGHAFMVRYATITHIQTVHNSRFFPVLAFLPTMHLLLLLLRNEATSRAVAAMAVGQTFILTFMILCRVQIMWQALMIVAAGLLFFPYRIAWNTLRGRDALSCAKAVTRKIWPAILVAFALVGLSLYLQVVPDRLYRTTTKTHVFWHPLYAGTIRSNAELRKLYSNGADIYGDMLVYLAVRAELRERNDISSPIAYVHNGQIEINIMRNMGAYDKEVRRALFKVVKAHPWLVLKSFLYDKPRDQFEMLGHAKAFEVERYHLVGLLGLGMVAFIFAIGSNVPRIRQVVAVLPIVLLVAVFSSATTLVVPSTLIVDTMLFYLILMLLVLFYFPAVFLLWLWRRRSQAAAA